MSNAGLSLSRRGFLHAGIVGLGGLTLADVSRGRARAAVANDAARHPTFGRARSCIVVWLKGGPSQLDMLDPRPDAPAEVRGEFKPIATRTPGVLVSEHLPHLAGQSDKYAVLHTLGHSDGTHSTAAFFITTGRVFPRPGEAIASRDDPPHFGSAVAALGTNARPAPPFVMLPDLLVVNGELRGGQHAGFLGSQFDPLVPGGDPNSSAFRPDHLNLVSRIEAGRLKARAGLLATLSPPETSSQELGGLRIYDEHRRKALDLLSAAATQRAFDLESESPAVRERYGRTSFGQSVLVARRLVEAGVQLVHVNCMSSVLELDRNWDTHKHNFATLRDVLLPRTDRGVAALLADLADRGLLDETLVIMLGEFGRTPKINADAGRDHWPAAQSVLLAGAGIPGGMRYGATDAQTAYPTDRPVKPAQFVATLLHALGVDPHTELRTREGRPHILCDERPVLGLWG